MGLKKSGKYFGLTAWLMAMLLVLPCFAVPVSAEENDPVSEIEQVYVNMPEIKVYFSHIDPAYADKTKITGFCGDRPLTCTDVSSPSDGEDGVDYYVLLDVSVSISEEAFDNMKQSVSQISDRLRSNDRMFLMTFGNQVKEVYRSDQPEKPLTEVLQSIHANSGATSLYAALAKMARQADSNYKDNYARRECILFTDGYDEAVGKESMEETMDLLLRYNIPVHTVSAVSTSDSANQKLGEMSRRTGGSVKIPGSVEAFSKLTNEVLDEISSTVVVTLRAENNIADFQEAMITVRFADKELTRTKKAMISRWQKDETAPIILSAEPDGTNRIRIAFSENVKNADKPENFSMVDGSGKEYTAAKAAYEAKDGTYQTILTFDADVVRGDYTISCKNIFDDSMEKNPPANSLQVSLEGVDPPAEQNSNDNQMLWIVLISLAGVVLLVIVVLLILVIKVKKRGTHREETPEIFAVPQAPSAPSVPMAPAPPAAEQAPQEVVVAQMEKKAPKYVVNIKETATIFMRIQLSGGESNVSEVEFEKKLVVGRSADCDVCIEDKYLARKQFMIEKENDSYFLSDLHSTNGTSLNGVRITSRQKLSRNDVITAGSIRVTVSWN